MRRSLDQKPWGCIRKHGLVKWWIRNVYVERESMSNECMSVLTYICIAKGADEYNDSPQTDPRG